MLELLILLTLIYNMLRCRLTYLYNVHLLSVFKSTLIHRWSDFFQKLNTSNSKVGTDSKRPGYTASWYSFSPEQRFISKKKFFKLILVPKIDTIEKCSSWSEAELPCLSFLKNLKSWCYQLTLAHSCKMNDASNLTSCSFPISDFVVDKKEMCMFFYIN